MPRNISTTFRQATEARYEGSIPLIFLKLDHSQLIEPICVVSDIADYIYDSQTWMGNLPFEVELVTDTDSLPRARLRLQNVDRRIGEVVRALTSPVEVVVKVLSSDDFDLNHNPRTPFGTPTVQYEANSLLLRDIKGDSLALEGSLSVIDPTTEPYPAVRATKNRLPGLYR